MSRGGERRRKTAEREVGRKQEREEERHAPHSLAHCTRTRTSLFCSSFFFLDHTNQAIFFLTFLLLLFLPWARATFAPASSLQALFLPPPSASLPTLLLVNPPTTPAAPVLPPPSLLPSLLRRLKPAPSLLLAQSAPRWFTSFLPSSSRLVHVLKAQLFLHRSLARLLIVRVLQGIWCV